jgi:hypothetical protein
MFSRPAILLHLLAHVLLLDMLETLLGNALMCRFSWADSGFPHGRSGAGSDDLPGQHAGPTLAF